MNFFFKRSHSQINLSFPNIHQRPPFHNTQIYGPGPAPEHQELSSLKLLNSENPICFSCQSCQAWKISLRKYFLCDRKDFRNICPRRFYHSVINPRNPIFLGLCNHNYHPKRKPSYFRPLGAITWRVSAWAEISARSPGWNFVTITWLVSARAEIWNCGEKWETAILFHWKHNHWACLSSLFSPGWNLNVINYMRFYWITARAEISSPVWQTGLEISARAEIQPGLKKVSPCIRKRLFNKICSGGRAEISASLTGLKFQPRLKFAM